jgi:hypothetical protein
VHLVPLLVQRLELVQSLQVQVELLEELGSP